MSSPASGGRAVTRPSWAATQDWLDDLDRDAAGTLEFGSAPTEHPEALPPAATGRDADARAAAPDRDSGVVSDEPGCPPDEDGDPTEYDIVEPDERDVVDLDAADCNGEGAAPRSIDGPFDEVNEDTGPVRVDADAL